MITSCLQASTIYDILTTPLKTFKKYPIVTTVALAAMTVASVALCVKVPPVFCGEYIAYEVQGLVPGSTEWLHMISQNTTFRTRHSFYPPNLQSTNVVNVSQLLEVIGDRPYALSKIGNEYCCLEFASTLSPSTFKISFQFEVKEQLLSLSRTSLQDTGAKCLERFASILQRYQPV